MPLSILVTGSDGQLGSEIQAIASQCDWAEFHFTTIDQLDLAQKAQIEHAFYTHNYHYCINCSAYTAVDRAEDDKETAYLINAQAVGWLGEIGKKTQTKIIHVSTDYVFDGVNHRPYAENDPTHPLSVYGASKETGELLLMQSQPESIILRTAWLYSAHGQNFVKTMIRLGNEKESLKVVFDQVGSPTYARDLAKAILHLIQKSESMPTFPGGIYHYTNEGVASWYDFATAIHEMSGIRCHVEPCKSDQFPTKAHRPHYSILDKQKIKSTFALDIPHWRQSLRECIETINKH